MLPELEDLIIIMAEGKKEWGKEEIPFFLCLCKPVIRGKFSEFLITIPVRSFGEGVPEDTKLIEITDPSWDSLFSRMKEVREEKKSLTFYPTSCAEIKTEGSLYLSIASLWDCYLNLRDRIVWPILEGYRCWLSKGVGYKDGEEGRLLILHFVPYSSASREGFFIIQWQAHSSDSSSEKNKSAFEVLRGGDPGFQSVWRQIREAPPYGPQEISLKNDGRAFMEWIKKTDALKFLREDGR